jgi:hypothetical protein
MFLGGAKGQDFWRIVGQWSPLNSVQIPANAFNNSRVDHSNSLGDLAEIVEAQCQSDNTGHPGYRCPRHDRSVPDIGHPHTPGLAAQPDIEAVSRRSDNSGHRYQYRSHVRSTELGSISHPGSGRLSQAERRLLRRRRW